MGTPSLQPFLKSYWLTPVQMTGQLSWSMQIMTSSRQYKCGARDNYVRIWYWTPISWTSSDHGDYRSNRRRSLIELSRDIKEKFSVMGTIFNPAMWEATYLAKVFWEDQPAAKHISWIYDSDDMMTRTTWQTVKVCVLKGVDSDLGT